MPTDIMVDTKAATCAYPAPASIRVPPRGKAIKLGINVIEPMIKDITIPKIPDSEPMKLEIISGLIIAKEMPTNSIIDITLGNNLIKDAQALFILFLVLPLSFKNEISNNVNATKYRIIDDIFNPSFVRFLVFQIQLKNNQSFFSSVLYLF